MDLSKNLWKAAMFIKKSKNYYFGNLSSNLSDLLSGGGKCWSAPCQNIGFVIMWTDGTGITLNSGEWTHNALLTDYKHS